MRLAGQNSGFERRFLGVQEPCHAAYDRFVTHIDSYVFDYDGPESICLQNVQAISFFYISTSSNHPEHRMMVMIIGIKVVFR